MNKYQRIRELELMIQECKAEIEELKKEYEYVSRGDKVRILREYEWVCSKGAIMEVDSSGPGMIYCVYPGKSSRDGIFWISDGDWVKI